jgi:hypothetical protein
MLRFTHSIGAGVHITFNEKPDERIRSMLKANGFRWSPSLGEWWRRSVSGAADFLAALDRAVGPRRPDGVCWRCKSPEGYFRPRGAATPVYCDACDAKNGEADTIPDGCSDLDYEDRCREACGL